MTSVLCLTIRFLDPLPQFHGRGADGDPEWPPSALRLFQALACAAAARWRDSAFHQDARPALRWIEAIQPSVVTPGIRAESFGYRMYVPNNSGDLMTAAWARGDTETSMAKFRVEKDVRPTHLAGDAVHYLFPLAGPCPHFEVLREAARSITHLGWGIDMVAGDAAILSDEDVAKLPGEVWRPTQDATGTALRVPKVGTLDALMEKHQAFLHRLTAEGFKPVPPLGVFDVVHYRRATDPAPRPFAAFSILQPDASGFRPFDTQRKAREVAGMVRCAMAKRAEAQGWPPDRIKSFVQGHGDEKVGQAVTDDRLMFLPLPSITPLKVESVRRVIVASPPGSRVREIQQMLAGADLIRDGETEPVAILSLLPQSDKCVKPYSRPSRAWSTVTPVLLPGYDDPAHLRRKLKDNSDPVVQKRCLERLDHRTLDLLKKAFRHAGFAPELVEQMQIEWRRGGFRAGVDLASRYCPPKNLAKFPAYHVRVRFPHSIPGPLAVGAGRYRGFGLFAAED